MSKPPDFICIGAAKAGTTWLRRALKNSPGYWMPPVKELRYFGQDIGDRDKRLLENAEAMTDMPPQTLEWFRRYVNGSPKDDAWYLSLFEFAGDNVTGDVSPAYAPLPVRFIEHAKRLCPDASILTLVRNPFERNVSHLANLAAQKLLGQKKHAAINIRSPVLPLRLTCCVRTSPLPYSFARASKHLRSGIGAAFSEIA